MRDSLKPILMLLVFSLPVAGLNAEPLRPQAADSEAAIVVAEDAAANSSSEFEIEPQPLDVDQGLPTRTAHVTAEVEPSNAASVDQPSLEVTGADTGPKPVRVVATLSLSTTYDDNIFIQAVAKESDLVSTVAPTFAIGLGDVRSEFRRQALATFTPAVVDNSYEPRTFIFLRYTPSATIFVDHSDENALNHDVALEVRWKMAYLTVGSRTSFQTSSDANVDVGNRVDRTTFSEGLTAFYDYSQRTSFEFGLTGSFHSFSGALLDSQVVESLNWVNYSIGARTHVGAGFGVGYLTVTGDDSQFYQQLLARAQYSVTDKINLSANAGLEWRQFKHGGTRLDPVFGGDLTYQPFEQSTITLAASRSIQNSASLVGEDIASTEVSVDFRQRLFRRYYLCFKGDYLNADYIDTGASQSFSRHDNVYSLTPYVRMDLPKGAALTVGYSSRHDVSTLSSFSFSQNQAFIQMNLVF